MPSGITVAGREVNPSGGHLGQPGNRAKLEEARASDGSL